jgi:hypothetical protein
MPWYLAKREVDKRLRAKLQSFGKSHFLGLIVESNQPTPSIHVAANESFRVADHSLAKQDLPNECNRDSSPISECFHFFEAASSFSLPSRFVLALPGNG